MLLIYNGTISNENIKKAKLTQDEIMEAIREHGVSKVEEVDLAVLEVDGNISVLSNDFRSRTVKKRKSKQSISQKN